MSSFELKPMGSTNKNFPEVGGIFLRGPSALVDALPTIEEVVWTANRSPVPPLLADRVPGEVWARTCDAVRSLHAEDLRRSRESLEGLGGGLPFIPCCLPCIVFKWISGGSKTHKMHKMQASALEAERAWLVLVRSERETYAAYGVAVTIATEVRHVGDAASGRAWNARVGLRFDTAATTGASPATAVEEYEPPVVVAAEPIPQQMKRPAEELGDQLEKIRDLHQQGALTEADYAAAKAKLLGL